MHSRVEWTNELNFEMLFKGNEINMRKNENMGRWSYENIKIKFCNARSKKKRSADAIVKE